jgi:hypothetical protein
MFSSADGCDQEKGRSKEAKYPMSEAGLLRLPVLSALCR